MQTIESTGSVPQTDTLWLEVRSAGRQWIFDLPRGGERAVSVGGGFYVDLRLEQPGVAPLSCHFERDGEGIFLMPAYGVTLHVNAARVTDVFRILSRAVVEFAGVRLDVQVTRERPAIDARAYVAPGARVFDARSEAAISDAQATRAVEVLRPDDAMATAFVAPLRESPIERRVQDVAFAATEAMPLERFDDEEPPQPPIHSKPLVGPAVVMSRPVSLPGFPRAPVAAKAEVPSTASSTRTSTPSMGSSTPRAATPAPSVAPVAPRAAGAPDIPSIPERAEAPEAQREPVVSDPRFEPVPLPVLSLSVPARGDAGMTEALPIEEFKAYGLEPTPDQATSAFDVESLGQPSEHFGEAPSAAPAPEPVGVPAPKAESGLHKLGTLAKEKPVLVFGGAAVGALVLSLALIGVTRIGESGASGETASGEAVSQSSAPSAVSVSAAAPEKATGTAASAPPPSSSAVEAPTEAEPAAMNAGKAAQAVPNEVRLAQSAPVNAKPAHDPDVAAAVQHVASGRYDEAAKAYAALAKRSPETKSYEVLARLLERRASGACAGSTPSAACPEVRP